MPGPLPRDPFTTGDARAAGYSPRQIQRRLDSGEWIALRRGVYCTPVRNAYAHTSPRLRHELDILAAQLAVRRLAVASRWSAAVLHGLPTPSTWAGQPPPVVTLTVPIGHGSAFLEYACARARLAAIRQQRSQASQPRRRHEPQLTLPGGPVTRQMPSPSPMRCCVTATPRRKNWPASFADLPRVRDTSRRGE